MIQAENIYNLKRQAAYQQISDFLDTSNLQVKRNLAVYNAEVEYEQRQQLQADLDLQMAHEKSISHIQQIIADTPMLKSLSQLNLPPSQIDDLLRFENFVQFFKKHQTTLTNMTVFQEDFKQPELQKSIQTFQTDLQKFLEKINLKNFIVNEFDAQTQLQTEPYDGKKYDSMSVINKDNVLQFVYLIGSVLQQTLSDQKTLQTYYQQELPEKLIDQKKMQNEEELKGAVWFLYKDGIPVENDETQKVEAKNTKKDKKEDKKEINIQPDLDYKQEYVNLHGTKVILVAGCRKTGKTDFIQKLVQKIKTDHKEEDYQIDSEEAIVTLQELSSPEKLIEALEKNITQTINAPKFVIIDGIGVFDPAELNQKLVSLQREQSQFIDNFIQQRQKSLDKSPTRASLNSAQSKQQKQMYNYSGFFKIYLMNPSVEDFISRQFGRIYDGDNELFNFQNNISQLIDKQLEGKLKLVTPYGQNFTKEYQLFSKFFKQLHEYYDDKIFGISLDQQKVLIENPEAESAASQICNQLSANTAVLDFQNLTQQRMNQMLLLKAQKFLQIEFNTSVEQFFRKRDEFGIQDPKKFKTLQFTKEKVKTELDYFDQRVLGVKNLQAMLERFLQLKEKYEEKYNFAHQSVIKAQITSAMLQKQQTQRGISDITEKFSGLLKNVIESNFNQFISYQNAVQNDLKTQDIIISDQLVMLDKILQENLQQIQKLYGQIQNSFKTTSQESVQLNKKLSAQIIQKVDQFLSQCIEQIEKPPSEVAQTPSKDKNAKQKQPEVQYLTQDSQLNLLQIFSALNAIKELAQAAIHYQVGFKAMILNIQASISNYEVPVYEFQKKSVNTKALKQIDPQIQLMESNQYFAQIDQQLSETSADRYLDLIEQVFKQYSIALLQTSPSGECQKCEPNAIFEPVISEFEKRIKDQFEGLLEIEKSNLKDYATTITTSIKEYQDVLEQNVQTAGQISMMVVQKLQEKMDGSVAGIEISYNGEVTIFTK
uniref:Uncharacterized protein n=1 Tax=Trepomonas sp. PC1 TaxID=1076344 RepID=A0A146K603_9EUKA|eukprot:JAP91828.1 Hypothetical protein TPC1_16431 [Trepomonas sp. PC1]